MKKQRQITISVAKPTMNTSAKRFLSRTMSAHLHLFAD
jgi:hypothetical protein